MRRAHVIPIAFLIAVAFSAQAFSQQLEQRNADEARAFRSQGLEDYNAGRLEEAVTKFKQAIRLKPGYAQAHNDLGGAAIALNRHGEAVEHLRHAIVLNPHFAEAYYNLGTAFYKMGRLADAIVELKTRFAFSPTIHGRSTTWA